MQQRWMVPIETPAGNGSLLLRLFTAAGPRRGFADAASVLPDHLGINLVLSGQGEYRLDDGRKWPLTPGTMFCRLPGLAHSTWTSGDYGECSLGFAPAHLPALADLGVPPFRDPPVLAGLPWPGARAAMQALIDRRHLADAGLLFAAAALVLEWCRQTRPSLPPAIAQAKAHLDHDPCVQWSLDELARLAGMQAEAFRRAFRQHVGQGPLAYRQTRRLERAVTLLETMPVKAVAMELGYSSATVFSSGFRRHFGFPPSACQRL